MSDAMNKQAGMAWPQRGLAIGLAMVVGSAAVACDEHSQEPASETDEEQPVAEAEVDVGSEEFYSPFVIEAEGDLPFEKITFTDVGIEQPVPEEPSPMLLETIAESLNYTLMSSDEIEFLGDVGYDKGLLDEANHKSCDIDHLYVAIWRGYAPERWGYSLWSGCHEKQKFAWEEFEDPLDGDRSDVVEWLEPLSEHMAERIMEGYHKECFVAECEHQDDLEL